MGKLSGNPRKLVGRQLISTYHKMSDRCIITNRPDTDRKKPQLSSRKYSISQERTMTAKSTQNEEKDLEKAK